MTPKEKAKELIDKYKDPLKNGSYYGIDYAQQCALIAVDEIINSYKTDYDKKESVTYWHPFDYWQQVKEEIILI